ncbi:MAG: signal peptidase I [Lachnospiraceae bacterium]|nr:signal peptidase I [Lachnospiraceae bacterium]
MNIIKVAQGIITVLLSGIVLVLLGVFFIPQCMGFQPYNIQTASMTPKYPVGSMIYVKKAALEDLEVGDVITYRTSSEGGWVVTHRLTQVDKQTGTLVTKGDANNTEDGSISYSAVIGKATNFAIPFLGTLVTQYQNSYGKVITVTCIVVLLALSFIIDLFAKKKE